MLFALASEQTPDKQGRISITAGAAGVRLAVQGLRGDRRRSNRIEIWDPRAWALHPGQQEQKFSAVQEEIFPGF